MGKVLTFINEKGGVGKTSACFNLAWAFSDIGKKVLMIDLDGQRANLTYFCGIEKREDLPTIYDILLGGREVKDTIVKVRDKVDIIPATVNVANLSQSAKISRMKQVVQEVQDKYDYIFIDVNPTPNWSHVLALSSTEYAVIVMLPDITSLEGNMGIIESVEEVQGTTNPNLKVLGLLFNKNENRTNLSKAVKERAEIMANSLNTKVFNSMIRNSVVLGENVITHKGITEYKKTSPAALDIYALADEIVEKLRKDK